MPANNSQEIQGDAKAYFRWVRSGEMTIEEARSEILISDKQLQLLKADSTEMTVKAIVSRRVRTWEFLMQLLIADASHLPAPDRRNATLQSEGDREPYRQVTEKASQGRRKRDSTSILLAR